MLAALADGREVRLEPRLMDLLLLFAGSGGRVVGKDEIIDAVWGGRAIGDDTLAGAVSRLRRALGETRQDRYIETLPKRGYRLLAGRPEASAAATPQPRDDLVARGRAALVSGSPGALAQARLYFEQALQAAPGRSAAHAGLAETLLAQHLASQERGALAAAKAAATAAVGLDDRSAAAWAALGLCRLLFDRDIAVADEAFRRAIALDPGLASAREARALALAAAGRFAEAEQEARAALDLHPLSLAGRTTLLQVLSAARRFGAAERLADETLGLAPQASDAWFARGWARVFLGREAAGVDDLLHGMALWGVEGETHRRLDEAYAAGGFAGLCREAARLFEAPSLMFRPRRTDLAALHAGAGETDLAFAALEAAADADDPYLLFVPWLAQFDGLKGDSRWPRLLERARVRG